jgi:hypothetical protein
VFFTQVAVVVVLEVLPLVGGHQAAAVAVVLELVE